MVIIKNVHPAIVSEEEYELVKATITFDKVLLCEYDQEKKDNISLKCYC